MFDKFGVDAIRFYLMSSPVMKGEDFNFSEKGVQDITSKIITRLDNVVAFYELYRDESIENDGIKGESNNVLDQWIVARLNQLTTEVTAGMTAYDMSQATRPFDLFIEDLSTWYLRRSRDRLKDGDNDAKITLYKVIKTLSILLAPFTPFIAEDIWQKLKLENDAESVHLVEWQEEGKINKDIISEMNIVRNLVTLGLESRQKSNIKVRQPLNELRMKSHEIKDDYIEILRDELNIKSIIYDNRIVNDVELDTHITLELRKEGQYRELIRAVQDMRKKEGLNPSDVITLNVETNVDGQELINTFKIELMKIVGAKEINIEKNEGSEVKIDELSFIVSIVK